MKKQKIVAYINSIAGYGRCSLTAALPVFAALGITACPLPTAVLSNHSGFPSAFKDDFTDRMIPYMNEWKKREILFDAIFSGYLGSPAQAEIVERFIREFKGPDTVVFVDPAMGDNGKLYRMCSEEMIAALRKLVPLADYVTPNMTEALALSGLPVERGPYSPETLFRAGKGLISAGARNALITGAETKEEYGNMLVSREKQRLIPANRIGGHFHGTGDIFLSVFGGKLISGEEPEKAVEKASAFTEACIKKALELNIPEPEGLPVELCLRELF